jgi:hypothetical protein
VALVIVLAIPALALAWSQTYVSSTYFYPDGIGLSDFNGSLNYNAMSWDPPYDPGGQAGPHYGQVTLCDSGYHCYSPYKESASGFVSDTRTISYGRGKCHAKASNIYAIWVHYCSVHN